MRIRHRWEIFNDGKYEEPVEFGLVAFLIIAILLTILGVVMTCLYWFSWWTVSFFVPGVLITLFIAGNLTYEAKGLTGPRRDAYELYRTLSRNSHREIRLNPQSLRRMNDEEIIALHEEFVRVLSDEKDNAAARRASDSEHVQVLRRAEERRARLALETRASLDKVLYEGWTSQPDNNDRKRDKTT